MAPEPDTRPSLIVRLQGGDDQAAWQEFASLYRPVILRLAKQRGLQHDDAEDVAQGVLLAISKCIADWQPDPDRARFRTWLHRVVRNATINAIVRRPADRALGGTTAVQSLEELAEVQQEL